MTVTTTMEFSRSRSICILAVVVGCLAILWPKIFYPMLQEALSIASDQHTKTPCCSGLAINMNLLSICGLSLLDPNLQDKLLRIIKAPIHDANCSRDVYYLCDISLFDEINHSMSLALTDQIALDILDKVLSCVKDIERAAKEKSVVEEKKEKPREKILPPKIREMMGQARPDQIPTGKIPKRPFIGGREEVKYPPLKGGGLMGVFMPCYTIALLLFFLYILLKFVFRNKEEDDVAASHASGNPLIPDYHFDAEQRKFVLEEEYDERGNPIKRRTKTMINNRKDINDIQEVMNMNINTLGEHAEQLFFKKRFKHENRTEKVVKKYGKDKENELNDLVPTDPIANALRTLISDMEQFKSKLVEVEMCKTKLAQLEAARDAAKECLLTTFKDEIEHIPIITDDQSQLYDSIYDQNKDSSEINHEEINVLTSQDKEESDVNEDEENFEEPMVNVDDDQQDGQLDGLQDGLQDDQQNGLQDEQINDNNCESDCEEDEEQNKITINEEDKEE